MGLIDKFFGRKKTITSVLINTQNNIFKHYGVYQPTDAQKMKASVYLCISGMAILNHLGGGRLRNEIDALVNETRELTKPLNMRVDQLSNNNKQLEKILADFPAEAQVTGATRVNGLAAFEALYFSIGEELMSDILAHTGGPMGAPGYASIVVADGIFGEGKSKEHFMEISMELLNFTKELTEVI
jgi:hypothetical protein